MRDELARWMEALQFERLDQVRGTLSLMNTAAPGAFERAQYLRTLADWSSLLGYQAYLRAHGDDDPRPS